MKWKIGLSLIGLLIVFLLINAATENSLLICRPTQEAAVGDDVTLDFHFEPQHDVKSTLVEWKFNNISLVLVYKSRGFSTNDQAIQFKDRASLDSSGDLAKGKLPVKISSVSKSDAGTYSCFVGKGKKQISNSIKLIIGVDAGRQLMNEAQKQSDTTYALVLVTSTFLYLLY